MPYRTKFPPLIYLEGAAFSDWELLTLESLPGRAMELTDAVSTSMGV